ncbi:MAG: HD domain-containing protein [Candidatus Parcubacteria bacterium]|nr:HD domain-containing protein [Candidatus Parcubacteria bacterium]
MNHTPQIKKAIQFAARKHDGLYRKDAEPLPAITHLFSVALLVAEDGAHDDVVTAALLHDTIEDTKTTADEIEEQFGPRVRMLVEAVSEPSHDAAGRTLSWRERKEGYFKTLESAPDDALDIVAADKIDNIESKLAAFEEEGPALFKRWPRPASEYLWYHATALALVLKRIPNHSLTKRLAEVHEKEKEVFS